MIDDTHRTATFSPCRKYRYDLIRRWSSGPTINFLCLNPSTADEIVNDATVERCENGYGRLVVTNIFAWRSTDPNALRHVADPIGPDNDAVILHWVREADTIVCAWGQHGLIRQRGMQVRRMLE